MMATCVYRSVIVFFHLMVWTVEVCPETTIVGFIGDSIVIPCSSEEHQPSIQDITVRWRYNFLNVYDIIKGADSEEEQDPAYKNRVETFPKEYLKGNYSLRLNNLQNTDTGPYTCYIIEESIMQNVNLIIEDNPVKASRNQGTKPRPDMIAMIMSLLFIGITFILANSATGHYTELHVPVPSPDKRRRGWMPIH
ncbi:CD276 antigen homolog isoform X1 [Pseudorasbora parva]|uniref:CD276 antigen homolog isoform X1 n=1 Tax=Pseudorasbora parva TaxID=51549 RepID=UPI00351ED67B